MIRKLICKAAFLASAMALPFTAMAGENGLYGSLGAGIADLDGASVAIGQARLGYSFLDNFALEADGSVGLNKDTSDVLGVMVETKIDYAGAGFAVLKLPAGDNFEMFVRGGYQFTKATATSGMTSVSATEDGIAFGAGVQYWFAGKNGVRVDYTNYGFDGGASADLFTLSFSRKF